MTWFRKNHALTVRIGLSSFIILILVIQNSALMPQALGVGFTFPNSLLPSTSSSPITVNKDVPFALPSVKELQPTDVTPSPVPTCGKLTPTTVTANGNDGNVPTNTVDNNLNTRWSNNGKGSWIQLDLGEKKNI